MKTTLSIVALTVLMISSCGDVFANPIFVETEVDELQLNGQCSLREALSNAQTNTSFWADCEGGFMLEPDVIELQDLVLTRGRSSGSAGAIDAPNSIELILLRPPLNSTPLS